MSHLLFLRHNFILKTVCIVINFINVSSFYREMYCSSCKVCCIYNILIIVKYLFTRFTLVLIYLTLKEMKWMKWISQNLWKMIMRNNGLGSKKNRQLLLIYFFLLFAFLKRSINCRRYYKLEITSHSIS